MTKPFRIFTVCYGNHIDWLNRALVRSLAWPKNKAALQNAKWTIWGDLEDTQRIYEIATKVLPFHQIELKQKVLDHGQVDLLACMMQTMKMCLLEKVPMLTAPPDTIFSDGSVDTILEYGQQEHTCVAVPHPRVLPDIMHDLTEITPSNGELVTLALEKYPHQCWVTAQMALPVSGVNVGGVCWQRLGEKLYAVQHRLPTVYLSNFTDDDRKFFSKSYKNIAQQYGMWDHEWPGAELMPRERIRTIGSSDLAFIVECTEHWKNIPTQRVNNVEERDAFHRDEYHNKIFRQYFNCFRGE